MAHTQNPILAVPAEHVSAQWNEAVPRFQPWTGDLHEIGLFVVQNHWRNLSNARWYLILVKQTTLAGP